MSTATTLMRWVRCDRVHIAGRQAAWTGSVKTAATMSSSSQYIKRMEQNPTFVDWRPEARCGGLGHCRHSLERRLLLTYHAEAQTVTGARTGSHVVAVGGVDGDVVRGEIAGPDGRCGGADGSSAGG